MSPNYINYYKGSTPLSLYALLPFIRTDLFGFIFMQPLKVLIAYKGKNGP